jgi:hypothetical protein
MPQSSGEKFSHAHQGKKCWKPLKCWNRKKINNNIWDICRKKAKKFYPKVKESQNQCCIFKKTGYNYIERSKMVKQ